MSTSNMLLPFTIEDSARKKRFSAEMEVAAILCIAEAERRRKTGILRGAVETLAFISKVYYPFWAIPRGDNCLLVDGMKTVSANLLYSKLPDIEAFTEHLKRSSTAWELYANALRSHRETFSKFTSQSEFSVDGLVTNKELLTDMSAFMKDIRTETSEGLAAPSTLLLRPKIDEENAAKIGEKIEDYHSKLQSEMKGLQFAIESVSEETKTHVEKLRQEMQQIREKYEIEIADVRVLVEKRKSELEKERDDKMEKIAAAHKVEVEAKLGEKEKWQRDLVRLQQDKNEFEKRKELRDEKEDEIGKTRWEARLQDIKNQISTVKAKTRALSDFISRSNKEAEKTLRELGNTYRRLVDNEMMKITELEKLRDSEIGKTQEEMEKLQRETLSITNKIKGLIDQKEASAEAIEKGTIAWKTSAPILIQVPFYVVQYSSEKEKRYRIYSPVIAKGQGGLMMAIRRKIKGRSLESRVNTLMSIRSKALDRLLMTFEKEINNKTALRSIDQLAISHNILSSANFRENVKKGMDQLEAESWIKPEEKAAILNVYTQAQLHE